MSHLLDKIAEFKVIPVVKIDNATDAAPLAKALIAGGLPVAEVTFRTDAAEEAIKEMSKFSEMVVGAGTITCVEQAQKACDAGAVFIVTAGFNRLVTEFAVENNIPIFPGVCTPTELMYLLEYKLPVAKFFPAEQFGGLNTIKALSGPFPNIRFMPTGGINEKNILEYLANPKIIACGGSWMVKDTLINEQKFDEIQRLTSEAVKLVK
ncbi:bifunctional 4-hydroxy-2-oxoglutarate aldolase/2-dehydro-3-deoxy-phosphogluconate aldolase [Alkalibaculum sp. M08DMB]|uniref:2-dehydro-3-deoxy-phosphogluconate aldolase n=1 Tax=Alkalibaculum sporogenes TaxID=2655001 RepID=A0A6A7K7P8_9FIRM|nr:bifunctional 4-hydroxy-2-oxoglutarate aldolase/2-dehydro-3-deoxy-phosphogluconate aldolase [Alkalibaculum sporogenes]MPW25416.1 bifunctional 4-hydroxy-2-oxoglutarate aldolase/2-dehydro-3-deoxy-phosphogluconate aldolase [Alkalibaculum sporogenes]